MPAIRRFLERFRPAGAPGAPGAALPVDRRTALIAELEPVFALLGTVEKERRQILDQADERARALREAARVQAAGLVEHARADAAAERAMASATVRKEAEEELDALLAAARDEAARIDAVAAGRLPAMVARAVRSLDVLLEAAATETQVQDARTADAP